MCERTEGKKYLCSLTNLHLIIITTYKRIRRDRKLQVRALLPATQSKYTIFLFLVIFLEISFSRILHTFQHCRFVVNIMINHKLRLVIKKIKEKKGRNGECIRTWWSLPNLMHPKGEQRLLLLCGRILMKNLKRKKRKKDFLE